MDLTENSSVVVTAGTTGKDAQNRPEALISALQFDRSLKMVSELVLDQFALQAATALKRVPGTDDFVVGCYRSLVVVNFSSSGFVVLNFIENVHSSKFFWLFFRCLL